VVSFFDKSPHIRPSLSFLSGPVVLRRRLIGSRFRLSFHILLFLRLLSVQFAGRPSISPAPKVSGHFRNCSTKGSVSRAFVETAASSRITLPSAARCERLRARWRRRAIAAFALRVGLILWHPQLARRYIPFRHQRVFRSFGARTFPY
jgi:hypothetical protein